MVTTLLDTIFKFIILLVKFFIVKLQLLECYIQIEVSGFKLYSRGYMV